MDSPPIATAATAAQAAVHSKEASIASAGYSQNATIQAGIATTAAANAQLSALAALANATSITSTLSLVETASMNAIQAANTANAAVTTITANATTAANSAIAAAQSAANALANATLVQADYTSITSDLATATTLLNNATTTATTISEYVASLVPASEVFMVGIGFTIGATSITLAGLYGSINNIKVHYNGVYQGINQLASLVGHVLSFTAPIPVGVSVIYVDCLGAVAVTPVAAASSIGVAQLASDTLAYFVQTNNLTNGTWTNVANYNQGSSNAITRTIQSKLKETVSVIDFGADPTGVVDSTAAFQNTINYLHNTNNGGILFISPGIYKITSTLFTYPNIRIEGSGITDTVLLTNHNSDGIKSIYTINSNTASNVSLNNFTLQNTNSMNAGGGYVDICGSGLELSRIHFLGFKYGIILDQTELATVRLNNFDTQLSGGAGIWLVNGADHTAGAQQGFTNRILITENEINQGTSTIGIAADGYISQTIRDNNFNGCSTQIRLASQYVCIIEGNEMEACSAYPITLNLTT